MRRLHIRVVAITVLAFGLSLSGLFAPPANAGNSHKYAGPYRPASLAVPSPAPAPTSVATFVTADTSTQGSWIGTYGADGYDLAGGPQSPANGTLSYGSYSVQGPAEWTWNTIGSTTDPRALETDTQGDRLAAAWYSTASFNFNVDFTDGNTHQVALYVLDWDSKGRSETVQIFDAASGTLLDTRSIPNSTSGSAGYTNTTSTNFINGTYLIWNISGNVTITVSQNALPNSVVSGIFFGGATQTQIAPNITSANNTTFTVGQTGNFTVTATGSPTPSFSYSGTLPTGVSLTDNHNGTATLGGNPSTNAASPYTVMITATNSANTQTQTFTLTVNPQVVSSGSSATFVSADTSTQGNWIGTYGSDGYHLADGPQSPANGTLSYGSYAEAGGTVYAWAPEGTTTDTRALETDTTGDRLAATWYSTTNFTFNADFTDGNTHQVALYVLDWDHQGRGEGVTVTDYNSGAVLDSRNIPNSNTGTTTTNFENGTYLIWNVSGHVIITVSQAIGPNAVVSGIFFGGGATQTQVGPNITSASNTTFTVGQTGSFTVTATGTPTPSFSYTGTLPTGVTLTDSHNGTATLGGNPSTNASSPYVITITATNSASSQNQTFTLTVNPQVVSSGSTATFVSADINTQGNWIGTYGADGYDLADGPQSPANGTLSYGSYSEAGGTVWPWAAEGTTTDPRALEVDTQGDRLAATWYSTTNFTYNVDFTDGNTHQVALYVLDWDLKGRGEGVTITDYNSGTVLDSRNIPNSNTGTTSTNFENGTYLIWNVSGHVVITVSQAVGPNAVASGIFFGGGTGQTQTAPNITSANNATFTVGQTGSFTVSATGTPTPSFSYTGTLPMGVALTDNHNGTATLGGNPGTNAASPYMITITAANSVSSQNQAFTLTVNPQAVSSGSTATFVSADASTQGNWIGTYGADGYDLADGPQSPSNGTLSYGNYAEDGGTVYAWAPVGTTTDPRALETDTTGDRLAATWYNAASFTFNVDFTDGNTHQVALYVLDWDKQGRGEGITVTDYNSGTVLDSRNIPNSNTGTTTTNFENGTYVIWNISGHVIITVKQAVGPNAVVSGIFVGGGTGQTQTAPNITSANNTTFTEGQTGSFTVTATGTPTPSFSYTGTLSTGVTLTDNHNGTATLGGNPSTNAASPYVITITATNSVSSQNQTFTLTVNPEAVNTGSATATFLTTDATTQGNWIGNYGIDGYSLAGSSQSLPSYAQSFTVQNQDDYVWASNPGGTSALQVPGGGSIAASWYSVHDALPPTFSFAVNFSDGKTHMLALYALDFDQQGRTEMIQIYDANSNFLLDTRYISNFETGVYALWNVSGSVIINVTDTVGPNSVISGVFFGGAATTAVNVALPLSTINLPPGQSMQFDANVTGTTNTNLTWSSSPSGVGSVNSVGYYTAPSSAGQTATVTATSTANSQKQAVETVKLTTGGVANFLATDTGTEGSYQGIYGADYNAMVGSSGSEVSSGTLSYGTFTVTNAQTQVWASSTSDPRALGGIASTWLNPTFNINVTDGKIHQLALYALDWDMEGRSETIQITDTVSGATLDSRTISNFGDGIYLIWNISGNITINVTLNAGSNPVIGGVFFGGAVPATMALSPTSVDLSAGQSQQFSANVNGGNGNVTWTIASVNPAGAASGSFSASTPGLYIAPSTVIAPTTVVISATSNGLTGTATVIMVPHATATSPAAFDSSTQGSWQGHYGTQGWSVAGATQSLPSFVNFSVTNNTNGVQTFSVSPNDPRALETGSGSGTIAAGWSKNHDSFSLNVDFTDNKVHQFEIYVCDYENQGLMESVQILDAVTGAVLDTEMLSNFENGLYLIWNISGNVTINITVDGNTNPNDLPSGIVSGAFFQ